MTILPDLHPDDATHRRHLAVALRDIRRDAGLRQTDLAAIHYAQPDYISRFERHPHPNPQIITLQRHARSVGHIADLILHGIDAPTTADMRTYAAVVASSTSPAVADAAARSLCIAQLTAGRRRLRLSRSAMAARMGVTDDTLYRVEAGRQESLLSTCQRYACALGGRLTVDLRPVEVSVVTAPVKPTARPGPNDILPCRSDSARRRHLAQGRTCETCGVGYEPLPELSEPLERVEAA